MLKVVITTQFQIHGKCSRKWVSKHHKSFHVHWLIYIQNLPKQLHVKVHRETFNWSVVIVQIYRVECENVVYSMNQIRMISISILFLCAENLSKWYLCLFILCSFSAMKDHLLLFCPSKRCSFLNQKLNYICKRQIILT